MEINVSFLKSKMNLNDTLVEINKIYGVGVHIDFMDGTFVDGSSCSVEELTLLKNINKLKEAHVMVSEPLKYLEEFSRLGIKYYLFHYEAVDNSLEVIKEIAKYGIRPGIVINPETSIDKIRYLLKYVDTVLVMSVNPGMGGQKFLTETLDKLRQLRAIFKGRIEVDGGVNGENISLLSNLCDAVVCGSYICMSSNYQEAVNKLMSIKDNS